MRIVRWAVVTLLTLSAVCAHCSAAGLELQPEGPPPTCAIEIEFRARRGALDFDGMTLDRVLRFAEAVPGIRHIYDGRRRYEDPPVLCLVIDNPNEALAIFERLTGIVPVPRARLPRLPPPPPVVLRYKGG